MPFLKSLALVVVGAAPALLLVLFAGLVLLAALPCKGERRMYALDCAAAFTRMAAVIVGRPPADRGSGD